MNLGHNVEYQNVLLKFDDGVCLTMPSGVVYGLLPFLTVSGL